MVASYSARCRWHSACTTPRMTRFAWLRLVSPLFLAGAIASACGSSTAGKGDTSVGASAGDTASEPGGGGGQAGDGTFVNASACPKAQPIAGSKCSPSDDLGPNGCHYPPPPPDCTSVIATCSSLGSWNLRLEPDYGDDTCSEDPESTCPDALPALDSTCHSQGTVCQYAPESITVCSVCDTWLAGDNGLDCEGAGGAPP